MDVVKQAFSTVPRANFMPQNIRSRANEDTALPIGYGQTISQPYTVEHMLTWLDPKPGHKVLDIGSGSGWTTALLAYLVGNKGFVYAVEKIPELVDFGHKNCQRLGIENVAFYEADRTLGLAKHAPFDRILVSASAQTFPQDLLTQLAPGGKLVIPIKHDILEIAKPGTYTYDTKTHSGFVFVPLV